MLKHLRAALLLLVLMTLLTGLLYPLAVTGLAQALFPHQANGSLIERNGQVVGSALIGQSFSRPGYFWGRPSATTAPDPKDPTKTVAAPYNAANSGGSNLAPSAKALADTVKSREAALRAANPQAPAAVPADLLLSSASGLDPDISPAAAEWQVARVAAARHAPQEEIRRLVAAHIHGRLFGLLGERTVNVLGLNLALDARWPMR
ncbi:potassium-transporting ATPase C chain [mine drainage metagenome]|uniref:Potassium-transporting ATPase C chain n=1 Tax=mine drainage metagenome TaxID=410659 RepID=A0A1J5TA43_9ZZZZ